VERPLDRVGLCSTRSQTHSCTPEFLPSSLGSGDFSLSHPSCDQSLKYACTHPGLHLNLRANFLSLSRVECGPSWLASISTCADNPALYITVESFLRCIRQINRPMRSRSRPVFLTSYSTHFLIRRCSSYVIILTTNPRQQAYSSSFFPSSMSTLQQVLIRRA